MISKKIKKVESPTIVYDNVGLIISKEFNGEYTFEFGKFISCDVVEAVSFLTRKSKSKSDSEIWSIEIDKIVDYNLVGAMYMLSGGDEFWNNTKDLNWLDIYPDMLVDFEDIILNAYNYKTLGEIRAYIIKNLNFSVFYEYFLKNYIQ